MAARFAGRVVAVIGNTGVGKSQLAVAIAKAIRGQVINTDSLQVYRGFDVLTNKMSPEEQQQVPHHLMSFVDPKSAEYRVGQFEQDAHRTIASIQAQQQVPVLVGGTHYYLQSLLWDQFLVNEPPLPAETEEAGNAMDSEETSVLYARLQQVDPMMAQRWHANDRRKIIRSLQVMMTTSLADRLRQCIWISGHVRLLIDNGYRYSVCIIWVHADPEHLCPRLDARVDEMVKKGLLDEIAELRRMARDAAGGVDYERGVAQGIGFKEFAPYFDALELGTASDEELERLQLACTEQMKAATRRYAKRQTSWIRNKLLPAALCSKGEEKSASIYVLDANDLGQWDEQVCERGVTIAQAAVPARAPVRRRRRRSCAPPLLTRRTCRDGYNTALEKWKKHTCPICVQRDGKPVVLSGEAEWQVHVKSRRHRRQIKYEEGERARIEKYRAARTAEKVALPTEPSA
ncbi:IPP transferase-domain-containing protein [Syncephalis pseudoplumigaleata]|uniref:tRNA dimethylallyltransferase n=1 Tax=Syncephalis pseudoplumigaleata TaxID=1712513 RepID=A0A4P9Z5I5_9FUNG|nr:IPP transferase-domain-containing protein [Syncephalis pseudoplumigaleata]|eukprot:RKP27883.1 IPP transferase-domain-containing protein [Syncephalis pseudoplumigaleata]